MGNAGMAFVLIQKYLAVLTRNKELFTIMYRFSPFQDVDILFLHNKTAMHACLIIEKLCCMIPSNNDELNMSDKVNLKLFSFVASRTNFKRSLPFLKYIIGCCFNTCACCIVNTVNNEKLKLPFVHFDLQFSHL